MRAAVGRPGREILAEVELDEVGHLPQLVDETPVALDALFVDIDVVAGRATGHQGKAQGVGAIAVHEFKRVDGVVQRLADLAPLAVAHHAVQIDGVEGHLVSEPETEHDHACHPEKEDVVAGLHHRGWVEALQIGRVLRPAEGAEGPQAAAKPCVEHVLFRCPAIADGRLAAHIELSVRAIPGRDAMPPPELPTDAPVLDVLEPVIVDLRESFWHDADAAVAHGLDGLLRQRLHVQEPLCAHQRLDDFAAALAAGHAVLN